MAPGEDAEALQALEDMKKAIAAKRQRQPPQGREDYTGLLPPTAPRKETREQTRRHHHHGQSWGDSRNSGGSALFQQKHLGAVDSKEARRRSWRNLTEVASATLLAARSGGIQKQFLGNPCIVRRDKPDKAN